MKLFHLLMISTMIAAPVSAESTRQLDAHEHGVGQLDIVFDGLQIAMELHAPGADIVGFEYAATSEEDRASVDAAVANLAKPLDLFVLPSVAGCSVVQAAAELESEEHDEEEHAKEEGHDDHADEERAKEEGHDDHADEEHAKEESHDDHADEDHAKEEGHDDHADEDHAKEESEAGHTEFHAEYLLTCASPEAIGEITFAYFETFPNALELEVQVISETGASAFEIERDAPVLNLRDML